MMLPSLTFLLLPLASGDVLVPFGATWRYLDDGSDQGTAWTAPGFADGAWDAGPAQLGYGDGDEATVVGYGPNSNDKYATTYFRHSFDVADPSAYVALELDLLRDDGAVVHLNGVEVARDGLAAGPVHYDDYAQSTVDGPREDIAYPFFLDPAQLVAGTNVLAVEIHQRDGASSDISLDLALTGHTLPVVWRGPYLQLGTPDSVRVRWRSAPAGEGWVWYGPSPSQLTSLVVDPTVTVEHDVLLAGLAPGATYYYAVGDAGGPRAGGDAQHVFRTAPPRGDTGPLRVWMLGDAGTASDEARGVRDAYLAHTAGLWTDFAVLLGDNSYNSGTDVEYQAAIFTMYAESLRRAVFWSTRGNHDTDNAVYEGLFTLPAAGEAGGQASGTEAYYAFDWGQVHFVCLDSQGSDRSPGGAMWTWLQADLAANDLPWTVAYWHHPPYTRGSHDSDQESALIEMRETFLPLLEDAGVDLVVCGHSHSYERSFLIDGHYGDSSTFGPQHVVDGGDGSPTGTGAYAKAAGPHAGSVYVVAGSAGRTGGGPLDHPAMLVGLDRLGSLVLEVEGGRMDVTFLRDNGNTPDRFTLLDTTYEGTYCTSAVNSEGCEGLLASSGTPSVSDPNPFVVSAAGLTHGKAGIFFYGLSPTNVPVAQGRLCVGGSLVRTAAQTTGGTLPCSGTLALDFNARIQSGVDQDLVAGAVVYCQAWYRDPQGSPTSLFTDALQFTIRP